VGRQEPRSTSHLGRQTRKGFSTCTTTTASRWSRNSTTSPRPWKSGLEPTPTGHPVLLSVIFPDTGAKEAVIFEQFGQLAGVTAYLHVHVELSISSVEAQLEKYRQLLKENCDSEMAVLNYMLTYANTSISNFTLRKETPDHPGGLSEKSMIRQNAKLWYKVAQLHLRDLEDMEESVATLRKSLPVIPNRNTGRIPVKAQFAPPEGSHIVNMQAYVDTQDHLLTLIPEKSYTSRNTNSPATVEAGELRNVTTTPSGSSPPKKWGKPRPSRRTKRDDPPEFIWGQAWSPPSPVTSSQPLTPEKLDQMTVVRSRREILGGIALGMAVAATALGVFNRVQINQLKTELFEVKENVGRLFEVVQDFSSNFAALETGFNEIRTRPPCTRGSRLTTLIRRSWCNCMIN